MYIYVVTFKFSNHKRIQKYIRENKLNIGVRVVRKGQSTDCRSY